MDTAVDVGAETAVRFWHADKVIDVVQLQQTDVVQGLTSAEVARRIEAYGKNQLPEKRKTPFIVRLWEQINNILIFILVVAAIVSAVLQVSCGTHQPFKRLKSFRESNLPCMLIMVCRCVGCVK